MANSPLTEATPDSLERLLNLDPLDTTDKDIDALIEIYRSERHSFKQKENAPKASTRAKKSKADSNLDLSDLGL